MLSVVVKVYERILIYPVRTITDGIIGEKKCGFKTGTGCVDKVFIPRLGAEKARERGHKMHIKFLDLEKTYGRVDIEGLWEVLQIYRVGDKLLSRFKNISGNIKACLRIRSKMSELFEIKRGLRQQCVMSLWLFNFFRSKNHVWKKGGTND